MVSLVARAEVKVIESELMMESEFMTESSESGVWVGGVAMVCWSGLGGLGLAQDRDENSLVARAEVKVLVGGIIIPRVFHLPLLLRGFARVKTLLYTEKYYIETYLVM